MSLKIAILDLYNGVPNQGMRCIQEILSRFGLEHKLNLTIRIFDVRGKNEMADTSFDVYLSSGGPGSPYDGEGSEWEENYFRLIDELEAINRDSSRPDKKYVLFICHSFQLICRKYALGNVCERRSNSFGIFPVHKVGAGFTEEIFAGLADPFYAVDSRDWQVIEPDEQKFRELGAEILALEKERPHVPLERAIMAIRFSEYFFGTQFHPEADPAGMRDHLLKPDKKQQVVDAHGLEKYEEMLHFLEHPEKLELTQNQVIPGFLYQAVTAMQEV